MRTPKLEDAEVQAALATLSGWSLEGGMLKKTYAFPDFAAAMQFVNAVADRAEAADHHPDIDIRYNKVTLGLVTHDSSGITQKDLDLAREADQV